MYQFQCRETDYLSSTRSYKNSRMQVIHINFSVEKQTISLLFIIGGGREKNKAHKKFLRVSITTDDVHIRNSSSYIYLCWVINYF